MSKFEIFLSIFTGSLIGNFLYFFLKGVFKKLKRNKEEIELYNRVQILKERVKTVNPIGVGAMKRVGNDTSYRQNM